MVCTFLALTAVASGIIACHGSDRLTPFATIVARVYGRVVTAEGVPINGAKLHVHAFVTCAVQNIATWRASGGDTLVTGADGAYGDLLRGPALSGDANTDYCVVVSADARPSIGLPATTATQTVHFVRSDMVPYDSARIDVVMR
jgi:hypothetical protein